MVPQKADLLFAYTRREEEEFVLQPRKRKLLQLPLIRLYIRVANLVQVILVARIGPQFVGEFGRANTFGTLADNENSAPSLGNMLCCSDAFYQLIKREVQRITSRTGNDKISCERDI